MADVPQVLDDILGAAYHAFHANNDFHVQALIDNDFTQMMNDPEFAKLARKKLSSMQKIDDKRCHITSIHKKFLNRMLNKQGE